MFLSPHLFSIHHLFLFIFFLAPKIISPPAEKPLLLFLVLLFILVLVKIEREGSRFYRVALSNENKNKIYLSSGLLLLLLFARVTCPFLFRFLIESNYYVTRAWNFSNFTADFGHTCNQACGKSATAYVMCSIAARLFIGSYRNRNIQQIMRSFDCIIGAVSFVPIYYFFFFFFTFPIVNINFR